jgi:hypothetical protein
VYLGCSWARRARPGVTLFLTLVVVSDGAAAQLLAADVVARRDGVGARLSVGAELRDGLLLAGAAVDHVDVTLALVARTLKQIKFYFDATF